MRKRGQPHPKVLLVEGKEELRVIPQLIELNGIRWGEEPNEWIVEIVELGGIEQLLKPGAIEAELKASGRKTIGIILDADNEPTQRWSEIRRRCVPLFPAISDALPKTGLIEVNDDSLRLGIWIMPDNQSRGMLETFLKFLIPSGQDPLLQFAEQASQTATELGAPFKEAHRAKANIHTWLSWQDPPGKQLHDAVMHRVLQVDSPYSQPFVRWFKELYQLADS